VKPGETASFKVRGEPFETGYVRLSALVQFSATGHIQVRSSEDSLDMLSEMAILAQPPVSKCTIPVFVNHPIAENTGIAVLPYYGVHLLLNLYTADGQLVGSKRMERSPWAPPPPVRLFVTELFPELPASFQSGSLVIEDLVPAAQAFVSTAVYTRGYSLRLGTVGEIEIPVELIVALATSGNVSTQANELAQQYHFVVREIPSNGDTAFLALMPPYAARVVAMDPRVLWISPNAPVYLSGGVE
jgi:hypothetical protein